MAIVGQSLVNPEAGWRRYPSNHTSISYIGTWTDNSTSEKISSVVGAKFKFNFTGNRVRIIAHSWSNRTDMRVLIDGKISQDYKTDVGKNETWILVYENNSLQSREHSIEVTHLGTNILSSLQAIDVNSTGELLPFNEDIAIKKHLIKTNHAIQKIGSGSWIDTGLVEPLTKADFETHGMDDLSVIPSEKWDELDTEFEVITWTDDLESDKFIEITTDSFSPIKRFNQRNDIEVLMLTDSSNIPILHIDGEIDVISRFDDPKIIGYSETTQVTSGSVSGNPKDNYYKYKVAIDDTSTAENPDDVLIDWSDDWLVNNISDTAIVHQGYINKVNPYNINVMVKQFDDKNIMSTGQVILYNNSPIFILGAVSYNTLSATIDDPDKDTIKYQVILNGSRVYPENEEWSQSYQTPYPLIYEFDKNKINIGITNTCILNVRDQFGEIASLDLSFVGGYDGLLFSDPDGSYYSIDAETIIKRLDFGTIIAGFNSDIAKVRLINQNYYKVKNIKLSLNANEIQPYTNVFISKTGEDNFDPQSSLLYTQELDSGEEVEFYVRIKTDMLAGGFSLFGVQVQADIVE